MAFTAGVAILVETGNTDADNFSNRKADISTFSGLKVARFETNSNFGKPVTHLFSVLGTVTFGALGVGLILKRKLKK